MADQCAVCGAMASAAGHSDDPGDDTRTLCPDHERLRGTSPMRFTGARTRNLRIHAGRTNAQGKIRFLCGRPASSDEGKGTEYVADRDVDCQACLD